MRRVAVSTCGVLAGPGIGYAQTAIVPEEPQAEIERAAPPALPSGAIEQQVSTTDRDRQTIRLFLQHNAVTSTAGNARIDIGRAGIAAAAMDGFEPASLAAQSQQAGQRAAGGPSKAVKSATAIVIVLVVVTTLVVALR